MSQQLQDALGRAQAAEAARAELQRRINEELSPELDRLRAEKAEAEIGKGKAEGLTRKADAARAEAEATARARQARINELETTIEDNRTEIERLRAEIVSLDAIEQEKRRQVAVAMRDEVEKADVTKWQMWGTLIMAALCAAIFIILHVVKVHVSWATMGWLSGVAIGLAFCSPWIMRVIDKVAPYIDIHWRKICIVVALTISGFVSSFGRADLTTWAVILLWIASFLGYGLLFQLFFESLRHLIKRPEDTEEISWRDKLATGYVFAFIGGVIIASIYYSQARAISVGYQTYLVHFQDRAILGGSATYLLYTLIGMACMGVVFVFGVLCYWLGSKVAANASGLFERERQRLRNIDKWLKACKTAAVFVAVVVGWIVGSGYSYSNGVNTLSSWVMAIAIGFGVSTVYYLIEGKVLEACFLRKYHWVILILLVLGGAVFATGTAYLSFGKVYYEASRGPRFQETQSALVAAESAYLAASEPTCLKYVEKQDDPINNPYAEALREMHAALEMANKATERNELMESASKFQTGGAKASICILSLVDRSKNLLGKVVVYPEPTPSDLSSQFWFGTVIEGTKVHEGSARQAMVAVFVLDFLIVILAIFGWLFASPQIKREEDDSRAGCIISVRNDGACIIDRGINNGFELEDPLVVTGEKGENLGSLTIKDNTSFGPNACLAIRSSTKMQVASGMRVRLADETTPSA